MKIIFFDIDNTLIDEKQDLPKSIESVFYKTREREIYRIICTGRNQANIQDCILDLEPDGYITGGGTNIVFRKKTIFRKFFKNNIIYSIDAICNRQQIAVAIESKEMIYMNKQARDIYIENEILKSKKLTIKENKKRIEINKIDYKDNWDTLNLEKAQINKICLWGKIPENLNHLLSINGNIVQKFYWKNKLYTEWLPKNCNKGIAIKFLCKELNISLKNTMSFGDSLNDIDMLKMTGVSIAMENSPKELIKVADSICESPSNDGIYKELLRRNII